MSLDQINIILFWAFLFVYVWQIYIFFFNGGVPNIPTVPAIRKKIIHLIQEDFKAKNKDHYKIVDLGSGDGKFSREIACALPQAQVTGVEISKIAYWQSEKKRQKQKIENLEYHNTNFFDYDFSKFDVLVVAQLDSIMAQLREKLRKELKPGTFVICNKFYLGGDWTPVESIDVKTFMPHQKTIHIYRA